MANDHLYELDVLQLLVLHIFIFEAFVMFSYFFDSVFGNFWMFLEGFKDLWVIECFKLNLTLRSAQVRTCALHLMQASNYIVAAVSLKLYSLDEDKNTMNFKNGSTVNKRIHNLLDITLVQVSLILFSLIIVRIIWLEKISWVRKKTIDLPKLTASI